MTPCRASAYARHQTSTQRTRNGHVVHSFDTLLQQLAAIVSNTCRAPGMTSTSKIITTPTPTQRPVLDLNRSLNSSIDMITSHETGSIRITSIYTKLIVYLK